VLFVLLWLLLSYLQTLRRCCRWVNHSCWTCNNHTHPPYLYMLLHFHQTCHYSWRNHYIRNEELYTVNRHCTLFDHQGM
jgi:hypothetical protein